MRGVWDGRRYPIIWFEKDWQRIKESFLYDEHLDSAIVSDIKKNLFEEDNLGLIEKIFLDLGRNEEAEGLHAYLNGISPPKDEDLIEIEIPRGKYAEVHCVAVCFSADGKALIAKRPATKKRYPGAYEFGCGQLELGESFADALKKAYHTDFGVDLIVDEAPIPIRSFTIEDKAEHRRIPGIIFVASVKNPDDVERLCLKEKHSDLRWIDPETFKEDGSSVYVPDFKETLQAAWITWKSIQNPLGKKKLKEKRK